MKVSSDLKKFTLNPKALDTIKKLDGDVVVVAMCGVKRTGKSWLLNQVIKKAPENGGVSNDFRLQ